MTTGGRMSVEEEFEKWKQLRLTEAGGWPRYYDIDFKSAYLAGRADERKRILQEIDNFDNLTASLAEAKKENQSLRTECERLKEARIPYDKALLEMGQEIDRLESELAALRRALEDIIGRGTDYDSTMNELVYIAREALGMGEKWQTT